MADVDSGDLDEREREQQAEAHALVGVVGALAGLREVPSIVPGFPSVELPRLEDAVDQLADAQHLPAPLRLELLARLHVANRRQDRGLDLHRFAGSLLREQSDAGAEALLRHLDNWVEGTDPLRRATLFDMQNQSEVASTLSLELQCTALSIRPGCGAVTQTIQGHQALSIVTDMITCKEFALFDTIVNPLEWPDCWLQKTFFKSMTPVSAQKSAPSPDGSGWTRVIEETCDFFFDLPGSTSPYLRTDLNFLSFSNPPPVTLVGGPGSAAEVSFSPPLPGGTAAAPAGPVVTPSTSGCAGCTYDLVSSVGQQILVDQGYLLLEQLPDPGYRRYRTQKQVCFAAGNLPPEAVCRFWALALALIVQGCS
jgi:hypothetical protein